MKKLTKRMYTALLKMKDQSRCYSVDELYVPFVTLDAMIGRGLLQDETPDSPFNKKLFTITDLGICERQSPREKGPCLWDPEAKR